MSRAHTPPKPQATALKMLLGRKDKRIEAAVHLLRSPDGLQGPPPEELLQAIQRFGSDDPTTPVMRVAQAWERAPLCHELFIRFAPIRNPAKREKFAGHFRFLLALECWEQAAFWALQPYETVRNRSLMLTSIAPLARKHALCWKQLQPLGQAALAHPNPHMRLAWAPILLGLQPSSSTDQSLLQLLSDRNPWVIDAVLNALAKEEPLYIPDEIARFQEQGQRLLEHPHPLLQTHRGWLRTWLSLPKASTSTDSIP